MAKKKAAKKKKKTTKTTKKKAKKPKIIWQEINAGMFTANIEGESVGGSMAEIDGGWMVQLMLPAWRWVQKPKGGSRKGVLRKAKAKKVLVQLLQEVRVLEAVDSERWYR